MKNASNNLPKYTNVPTTPPPRRTKPDQMVYQAQRKMEEIMHMLIHLTETQDMKHIPVIAALMRSAWQTCKRTADT